MLFRFSSKATVHGRRIFDTHDGHVSDMFRWRFHAQNVCPLSCMFLMKLYVVDVTRCQHRCISKYLEGEGRIFSCCLRRLGYLLGLDIYSAWILRRDGN